MEQGTCPHDLRLKWLTEVSSSVYSTPIITDLFSDGTKEVVVSSFIHYVEARCAPMLSSRSCHDGGQVWRFLFTATRRVL